MPLPKGYTLDAPQGNLPPGYTLDSAPAAQDADAPPSTLQTIGSGLKDLGAGVLKGGLHTISSADDWATKHLGSWATTPFGQANTPENSARATAYAKDLSTPTNTMQKIGSGVEQAGEFLIPGAAEDAAAGMIAKGAPKLATAGRYGLKAIGSGIVNKAQGGSFTTGAVTGAAGEGLAQGLKAMAPATAETALKVRATDRAYGATPGRAILDETKGISPSKIVETGRDSLNGIQAEQGNLLDGSPKLVSLTPTRSIASDFLDRAINENHEGTLKDLGKLGKQVDTEALTGAEIPEQVPASRAAALNRGISNAVTSWNPATANDTMNAAGKAMHHTLGNSIAEVVPEIKPLNQRVQSLMPVIQRGTAADLNAGILQRLSGRMTAHTGALLGGVAGYHAYGIPGAIMGAVGPEIAGSPEFQMGAARAFNSPYLRNLVKPVAIGAGLQQLDRSKN